MKNYLQIAKDFLLKDYVTSECTGFARQDESLWEDLALSQTGSRLPLHWGRKPDKIIININISIASKNNNIIHKHCQRHKNGPITWVNLSARIVQNRFQWHYLNWLQIWSLDGATCIRSKFGHQMAPLALVTNLVTRWRHMH